MHWNRTRSALGVSLGALALLAAAAMGGCNTVAGAGEDVSATGNAVTRGATETESKLFPSGESNQPQSAEAPAENDQRPAYQPSPAYSTSGQ